ncbi:MAG: glycosyltransferase family 4 protein [Planctomycetes bacterium]|nr:glycosyltransferase family 4 protein [Planctomycetota bacterium]
MRIALVTTPASVRSGIGDYTRHLLPYLRERAEVDLFVEDRLSDPSEGTRPVTSIRPREHQQLLYQLGNERAHAFMRPMLAALGGTVMLHDWVLFDQAVAASPELSKGGWRGAKAALYEGGIRAAKTWRWARKQGVPALTAPLEGAAPFAYGWHELEEHGRWSSRSAGLHLLREGADALRLSLLVPAGRRLELQRGARVLARIDARADEEVELDLDLDGPSTFTLAVRGGSQTPEQLENGDPRELGVFLREMGLRYGGEWRTEALSSSQLVGEDGRGLSGARFRLPFNRGVVRRADAFLTHSEHMRELILADRNEATPIGVIPHGVERRWEGRDLERARRELPRAWKDDFIIASLGALQPHKRISALLDGAARARERGVRARVLLIGEERPRELDLAGELRRLDMEESTVMTGWVEEERAHELLSAADVCVNLRGPSTGGASGGASQAFSLGRGVIVSDLPELNALPDGAVLRVPTDGGEAEALCEHIVQLAEDPSLAEEMGRAAQAYVEGQAHWSLVADAYLEALAVSPTPRFSRRGIVRTAIAQSRAERS